MLSWKAWLLLLLLFSITGIVSVRWVIHPFLAVNKPVHSDVLVVEGWTLPDLMKDVAGEFARYQYQKIVIVNASYNGHYSLEQCGSAAYLGSGLVRYGIPREVLVPITYEGVQRDRTYHTALAVRNWFERNGGIPKSINVATEGVHARRSWGLFQKALGGRAEVGILSFPDPTYDAEHWWRASEGVREVIDEVIAYSYATFYFPLSQQFTDDDSNAPQ